MARDWETQFQEWSRAPTEDETRKMERAEIRIREAIADDAKLQTHDVKVFRQGSYYNRTNVPAESDVDIRVEIRDVLFPDFYFVDKEAPINPAIRLRLRAEALLSDSDYTYQEFKNDVGAALLRKFGPPPAVERGDKAYDIHETRYQVESDCLAAFRHVRYARDIYGRIVTSAEGIEFISDKGVRILNFPDQQHANSEVKHDATNQRFRKQVRVMKNLRNEMDAAGHPEAKPIISFLIECLVYNVPNITFGYSSFYDRTREVIRWLYTNTETDEQVHEWGEESELKYLFRPNQPWTREQVHEFLLDAWVYVGFTN
jgi:hypothetical protein